MYVKSTRRGFIDIQSWLGQGAIISCETEKLLIGYGRANWSSQPCQKQGNHWFYFPDYFLYGKAPWLYYENTFVISIQELIAHLKLLEHDSPEALVWSLDAKESFKQEFAALQKAFSETDLEKAVPYVFSKASGNFTIEQRSQSLISLLQYVQKVPVYAYGFWNESEGILGATPEILFRSNSLDSQTLETMALAGTEKTELVSSNTIENKKLVREHQIVVDEICANLNSFGEVKIEKLQILSLPLISHLYTPISVKSNIPMNFSNVVKKLHPTSALGGFPRHLAHKWQRSYEEKIPRGRFGAPAGFLDTHSNQMYCYVAIRNTMWKGNELRIGAGCGIVKESNVEEEWNEILLKIDAIKSFLF